MPDLNAVDPADVPRRQDHHFELHISHVEFGVRDIEASVSFACEVSRMHVTEEVGGAVYLSCNQRHHDLVLRCSDTDCCAAIGFETAEPADLHEIARQVSGAGASGVSFDSAPGAEAALRFCMPDGRGVEIVARMATVDAALLPDLRRPRKLGHVSLKTESPLALERFLTAGLGLRTSDRVGDKAIWMRGDSEHHGVAIMQEPIGIHHYAYELQSWDAFLEVADDLLARGIQVVWGPGRHGPGNNLFLYFLDRAGCVVEYYFDLERIEGERAPGLWPDTASSFNLWGPKSPDHWHDHGLPHSYPPDGMRDATTQDALLSASTLEGGAN